MVSVGDDRRNKVKATNLGSEDIVEFRGAVRVWVEIRLGLEWVVVVVVKILEADLLGIYTGSNAGFRK